MIKTKDGYAKLIGTSYLGSASELLVSNGGYWSVHTGRNNEADKIVRTDASGYLNVGWVNTTSGDMGTAAISRIYASYDNFIRYVTPANFFSNLTNDNNQLSLTIGGQNRKVTVDYATNTDIFAGYTRNHLFGTCTNRNFTYGTLIKTSIDYSKIEGAAFKLEIKGYTYQRYYEAYTIVEGYIYDNTIICQGITHLGGSIITGIVAMNIDGFLCFWFPRQGYWEGYQCYCAKVTNASSNYVNTITDITDSEDPIGTKRIEFWHTRTNAFIDDIPTSHASNFINKLTGYLKYYEVSALATSDSLNTALGKLEYKADLGVSAYNLVNAAYDGDGTIENLNEILKVLEGIKDTDTIQAIIGKYLPLTGGVLTGKLEITTDSFAPLVIKRVSSGYSAGIQFINNNTTSLGYIGMNAVNSRLIRFSADSSQLYTIWDSGNDGSGSGLDADLLDGIHASGLFTVLQNDTSTNKISMTVGGTNKSLQVFHADKATYLTLTYCRDGESNSGLWNTIKNGKSNPQTNKVQFYTIYDDGGPSVNGDLLEILSYDVNHWQPQLWFGAGTSPRLYFRNKGYNNDTWGDWKTIAYLSDIPSIPSISVTDNTSGTFVTDVTSNGHTITLTRGNATDTKNTTGADNTTSKIYLVGVTSQTTNNGYGRTYSNTNCYAYNGDLYSSGELVATQEWVNDQGFETSDYYHTPAYSTGLKIATGSGRNDMYVPKATSSQLGVVKLGYSTNNKNYAVASDSNGNLYVNVPWEAGSSIDGSSLFSELTNSSDKISMTIGGVSKSLTVDYAVKASKIGTSNVGSNANPIYLSAGVPTAFSQTIGNSTTPVYVSSGTITTCSREIPVVTDYYWADVKISSSSSTSTSPTFGKIIINNNSSSLGTSVAPLMISETSRSNWSNSIGRSMIISRSSTSAALTLPTMVQAETVLIASNDCTTLRIYESGSSESLYLCAGDNHGRIASSHDLTFYTGGTGTGMCASAVLSMTINTDKQVLAPGGFYESSDSRLKNILNPVSFDLEIIKKIPKIYYNLKEDPTHKQELGTIAQDILPYFPEVVTTGIDGYYNVDYAKLSVIALSAIDKLIDEINSLKDKVTLLESKIK